MTNYVVGFLHDGRRVALIRKTKPEWQAGLLNGIGGKIELDEHPYDAMTREFYEEAGLKLYFWRRFYTLEFEGGKVYCFTKRVHPNVLDRVKTMEEEEVVIVRAKRKKLEKAGVIPNLLWLVPLALEEKSVFPDLTYATR
jgi:8-oxo-dGTP pyrophosphatase MutT (NUDIX family)